MNATAYRKVEIEQIDNGFLLKKGCDCSVVVFCADTNELGDALRKYFEE